MQHTLNIWPMYASLTKTEKQVGRWFTTQWSLKDIVPATVAQPEGSTLIALELYRDERASYRLNLDLDQPQLYLVCDELPDGTWVPTHVSACQNVAAGALEGDTPVLNFPMPTAIALWIENFMSRQGEVEISAKRRQHVNRRKERALEERK